MYVMYIAMHIEENTTSEKWRISLIFKWKLRPFGTVIENTLKVKSVYSLSKILQKAFVLM